MLIIHEEQELIMERLVLICLCLSTVAATMLDTMILNMATQGLDPVTKALMHTAYLDPHLVDPALDYSYNPMMAPIGGMPALGRPSFGTNMAAPVVIDGPRGVIGGDSNTNHLQLNNIITSLKKSNLIGAPEITLPSTPVRPRPSTPVRPRPSTPVRRPSAPVAPLLPFPRPTSNEVAASSIKPSPFNRPMGTPGQAAKAVVLAKAISKTRKPKMMGSPAARRPSSRRQVRTWSPAAAVGEGIVTYDLMEHLDYV